MGVKRVSPYPAEGTKAYKLLAALLSGQKVDPWWALDNLNLPTVHARCAELRRVGWPVRTVMEPHPRLPGEVYPVYSLAADFRRWIVANPSRHPGEYQDDDGRGKFGDWTAEDYRRGARDA